VAARERHSFFLKNDGTVWTCGLNQFGQLGDGTITDRYAPVKVKAPAGIIAVAAGYYHSLFLKSDSTVWGCGQNQWGQLSSSAPNTWSPVKADSLSGIIAIAAGVDHSLFLKSDGTVWACGYNQYGQLGDGSTSFFSDFPVQVKTPAGIIAIAAGSEHSLFLKNDGTVWACGYNQYGQLGDSTMVDKHTPVQISSLTGIIEIAGGDWHSVFAKSDGTVWACGQNSSGQLGDGTTIQRNTPVLVSGLCQLFTGVTRDEISMSRIEIFPNPATNHFCIGLPENDKKFEITITDMTGKIIYTTIETEKQIIEINTKDFANGIYIVQIQSADFMEIKKIIIAK
jgi:alpha-tubulin suppressor-like RCC1 family protein